MHVYTYICEYNIVLSRKFSVQFFFQNGENIRCVYHIAINNINGMQLDIMLLKTNGIDRAHLELQKIKKVAMKQIDKLR